MNKDLNFLTDTIFYPNDTIISKIDIGTMVRIPSQPDYYSGNFIYLKEAPKNEQKLELEHLFDELFKENSIRNHYTFVWFGNKEVDLSTYTNNNYRYERLNSLTLNQDKYIEPKKLNSAIDIRLLNSEVDWQKWIDLEVSDRPSGHSEDGFRNYVIKKATNYRQLESENKGNFYGAFINNELVASAGLFFKNNIGRFQAVVTKSEFRRKRICTTLLNHICKIGFSKVNTLVIVADSDYHALDLYKKLGFSISDSQSSLCWWKRDN